MPDNRKRGPRAADSSRGNRRRHAVDTATAERWALLGSLLRARRIELGYIWRTDFADAMGLKTKSGSRNIRMIVAMENNERPGTYAPGRLEQFARAYRVTPASIYALLDGRTDELVPAPAGPADPGLAVQPGTPAPSAAPGLPAPPQDSQLVRDDAVRPYADPIWVKLLALRDQGVIDPSGEQLGLSPFYAREWDRSARVMMLSDRVWLIGTLLRNAAAWNEDQQGATSA